MSTLTILTNKTCPIWVHIPLHHHSPVSASGTNFLSWQYANIYILERIKAQTIDLKLFLKNELILHLTVTNKYLDPRNHVYRIEYGTMGKLSLVQFKVHRVQCAHTEFTRGVG